MANEIQIVKSHGDEIETFEHEGAWYVAMKRVCKNIGLNRDSQRKTLVEQSIKFNYGICP